MLEPVPQTNVTSIKLASQYALSLNYWKELRRNISLLLLIHITTCTALCSRLSKGGNDWCKKVVVTMFIHKRQILEIITQNVWS